MAKELRHVIVFANGRRIRIPDPGKIIVMIRDRNLRQHQASVDVNIENVERLKKIVVRRKRL